MLNINDEMVMVGSTEFRAEMPKFFKLIAKKKVVVVMNRGEPLAVLQNFEEYQKKQAFLQAMKGRGSGKLN